MVTYKSLNNFTLFHRALNIKNKNHIFVFLAAVFIFSSGIATAYAAPTSPPTLKLVKSVTTDDGGSAIPDDWVLFALNGNEELFFNKGGSGVFQTVPAGIELTLAESEGPGGYTNTDMWSCKGGVFSSPNKITLSNGDRVTCTTSSNDIAPTLTLVKKVINGDIGDATADMWTLSATASGAKSSRNFSGNGTLNEDQTASITSSVFSHVVYDLAESDGPLGYSALNDGRWDCEITYPNDFSFPVYGILGISLAEGDTAVCTITNVHDVPSVEIIAPDKTSGKVNLSAKVKGFDSVVPVTISIFKVGANEPVYSGFVSSEPYVFSISPQVFDAGSSYLVTANADDDKNGKHATDQIILDIPSKGKTS